MLKLTIYGLDNWPRNTLNKFAWKDSLFDAKSSDTKVVNNRDKSTYRYSGYRIEFDGAGL